MTDRAADQGTSRWEGRPILSFLIRSAVFTIPILASVIVSIWLSKVLPEPENILGLVRWWAIILGGSTAVLFVVNTAARKFLPLAALMRMSMVFPDKAPGRFKTALRSGSSVKHLKAQLAEAERLGRHDDPDVAAEFILQLSNNLNSHDRRTRGHAERVRAYAEMLAEEMGLSEKERAKLRWASLLHDIGKLKISTDILNKPGRLNDDEWVEIKKHPSYGAEICAPLLEWLGNFADTIEDHHERFDGTGYPNGKKGDEISLGGRIVAVADAFDVMTTVRSYKAAMPGSAAREELARNAGGQFDPAVVRAFLNISMGRLRWVAGPLSWLAQLPFLRFVGAVQQVGTAVGVAGAAATGVAAVVGGGLVDLPGDEPLPLIPVDEIQAAAPPTPTTVPVATLGDDAITGLEDEPITFDLTANDGLTGAISIVDDPDFGRVVLNEDGTVTYIPDPDFNGEDAFSYVVDGALPARVVVQVGPVNDLPLAVDDPAEVDEDGEVVIAVLGNDLDTEGLDPSTLRITAGPFNGTAVIDRANGTITYTPNPDFSGTDGFTYVVADKDGAETGARVVIRVRQVNDPPTARDDSAATDEDTPVVVDVLANDEDPDGTLESVTVTRPPARGTATVAGGAIRYTPRPDFNGTDTFDYEVCDSGGECARASVAVRVRPVNDRPVLTAPPVLRTHEDTPGALDLLAGASDPDGDRLTVTVPASSTKGGALAVNGGTVTYTPAANFAGSDDFGFTVSDGAGGTVTGVVSVTVTEVNDPPVVPGPGPLATDEDEALTIDPLAGATDIDGDSLAVVAFDAATAAGGRVVEGSLIYTPPADYWGTDTFTYTVGDGRGGEVTTTVTVEVAPVNDAPRLPDGSFSIDEDTPLTVAVPGVLAAASDVDGDALTASIAAFPVHGTLALAADGRFTYTPSADWHGADGFAVTVSDGAGGWDTGTFSVLVNPVNDAPAAAAGAHTVAEDAVLSVAAPGVLAGATDPDGDALSVSVVAGPDHGSLVLAPAGAFTYTPDPDYHGPDAFTFAAADPAGASATATATIEVAPAADAPVATDDGYALGEDGALTIAPPGVLGNDADADGDTLTATLVASPANGALTLGAAGGFTYTPAAHWYGTDTFTYEVADGTGLTDAATVTLTVAPVNDGPVAADDGAAASEDATVTIDIVGNDTDVEDGTPAGAVTVVAGPANGTLTDNGDGTVDYTPDPDWNGADSFTYEVDDSAGATSNVATVTVTVAPVNDPPVANDDATTTPEDNPVVVAVVANDTDVEDGTPAGAITLLGGPAYGTVVDNGDGSVTYTPDLDWNGTDGFTYRVADGDGAPSNPATVTIGVGVVNDPPVANDDAAATAEDTLVTVDVVANDTDVEDGTPAGAVTVVAGPGNGSLVGNGDGTVDYTPDPDWNGVDSFTYQVRDAAGADSNVATVTVTVAAVNDDPVASDDAAATAEDTLVTVDVVANDTDVEDGTPAGAVTVVAGPGNGSLVGNGDGTFDYTPDPDWNGVDSFTYQVRDAAGADSNVATVTVTVAAVNDDPVASDDAAATAEDTLVTVDVVANDTDVEDGVPAGAVSVVTGPGNGSLVDNGDGTFDYTPDPDWNGVDSFTYTVDDSAGATSNTATVTITVSPVNDDPVANDDAAATAEDTLVTVDVVANDTDVEDGVPAGAVSVVTGPGNGSLVDNGDGTFDYTPDPDWNGVDSFTYTVDDSAGATSNTATVTITVSPVNDDPVANDDGGAGFTTGEDTGFTTADVVANDTDVEDGTPDATTTSIVVTTANGSLTDNGDGTFDYTPDPDWNGTDSFTYTVDDSAGATSNVATVTITVNPANDPPVVDPIADQTEDEGVAVTFTATASDPQDSPPDTITFSLSGAPAGATIDPNTGAFSWTPTEAQGPGVYSFDVVGTDDGSPNLSDTEAVQVTVNEANQPPVLDPVGAQSGDELTAITFTATATDGDLPANTLTFSLAGAVPPGAAINPSSGAFSWTPTEAQGPGAFTFDVVVGDGIATDSETITVTVTEANQPPVLDPIADPTAAEGSPITFTASATDPDLPAQGITYLLAGEPAGATIDPNTGAFSWTPSEAQGPGSYTFDVIAEDDGTPALSDVDSVTVTVTEVNQPPTATSPGDQSSGVGQPVSVFVPASDPDLPANSLTWDDGGTLPAGLSINAATGEITGSAAGAGTTTVTVTVDDGPLSDAVSFDWTVTASTANVKISEFRTTGPAGAADEFIELYNTGTGSQSLVGWTIQLYNGAGNPVGVPIALASGAVTDIQPKSWYLVAGSSYSGATAADQPAFADNIAIGGGAELLDNVGNTIDLVGSANPGTPLPRMSGSNDQSYERRHGPGYGNCIDTGTDTDDFVHNMVTSNPTNSTAAAEPCGTPPAPTVPVGPPHMVISEFRTSGPGGPNDEFVELFNPTGAAIDLNGYEIRKADGTPVHRFTVATPVVAGGHYTVGGPAYPGAEDVPYSELDTLASGGAVQLWDGSTIVDVVGMSSGGPFETRPLPPMTTSGSTQESYERVGGNCQDTDDNGADFFHNLATINPQTSADPPTPCPTPAGDVIVNEVLYADRVGVMDEMIEIYNGGSTTYDLAGWMVADGNVPIADLDATPFSYPIPATDLHGSPSLLPPGEYAVIWLQDYAAKRGAPFAALEFNAALGLAPVLSESGDDVFLFDDGGQPIDYVRWGAGAELNAPTLPWDGSFDAANAAAIAVGSGQSLALTPNGVDTDSSACWEPSDSGNAGGRAACAGAPTTQMHDTDLRLATPGVDNNNPNAKSSYYGSVAVNEVSNENSGDQFVEITNGTVAPVDISGWTVADGNLRLDELDGGGSSFDFTFPASSVLPPGGHAVVWVQAAGPETQASPFVDLEFWAGDGSSALKASADEMWIYDADLAIVDFMAWGGGGDPAKGEAPDPLADFWDDSAQGPLGSPPADSSLSLTADGVDSDDSACWEFTASGASGCGPTTVDNDDWPLRVASPGDDNNLATADLEVTVVADTLRPSNGGTVSYTVTAINHSLSNAVGGVEVTDLLPAGLTYLSDDSGGDYVPGTGVWSAGTVGANSSVALVIDATVTAAEGANVDNTATITGAARPDPDGANNADTESVTVNQSPTPVNDATTVLQAIPATIAVLGNDSDPDGDPLTITAWDATSTEGGAVDCSSGTSCTYTGAPGFGSPPDDTFTYTVDDGYGGTAVATVTVTVTAASGDPLFLKTDGTTNKGVVLALAPPPFVATHPGTPAVPDWNDNGDGRPGRTLQRAGAAPPWDEGNEDRFQTWAFAVTDAAGLDVGGPTRLRMWAAMKDFDTLQTGEFFVRISQCPTGAAPASNAADGCTSLGTGAYDSDPAPFAPSGGFELFDVNVSLPSITIPQGDELRVKVIGGPASDGDVMVAYDTDATVSVLYFP